MNADVQNCANQLVAFMCSKNSSHFETQLINQSIFHMHAAGGGDVTLFQDAQTGKKSELILTDVLLLSFFACCFN